MTIQATPPSLLACHADNKAQKARSIADCALSLESYVGDIPAWSCRQLYMALVDPHLTFGCETALDTHQPSVTKLVAVQHDFLRRMLRLGSKTTLAALFSEMGLEPLRYRRLRLVLSFMQYTLSKPTILAGRALTESICMADVGHPSWYKDLARALAKLPVTIALPPPPDVTPDSIGLMLFALSDARDSWLTTTVNNSVKLSLLNLRTDWDPEARVLKAIPFAFRAYLNLEDADCRIALCRLWCSEHNLAVERLCRCSPPVPRSWRICRLCRTRGCVEDEAHALLECPNAVVASRRDAFLTEALALVPGLRDVLRSNHSAQWVLAHILGRAKILGLAGRYVADIFAEFEQHPFIIIRSETEYNAATVTPS